MSTDLAGRERLPTLWRRYLQSCCSFKNKNIRNLNKCADYLSQTADKNCNVVVNSSKNKKNNRGSYLWVKECFFF